MPRQPLTPPSLSLKLRRPRETRPYEHVPACAVGTVDFYTFWGYVCINVRSFAFQKKQQEEG